MAGAAVRRLAAGIMCHGLAVVLRWYSCTHSPLESTCRKGPGGASATGRIAFRRPEVAEPVSLSGRNQLRHRASHRQLAGLAIREGDKPMGKFGRDPFDAFQFFAFQLPCAVFGSLVGTLAVVAILRVLGV
jgi:hypothetical protein